jgi:hypothetical protein
LIFGGLAAPLRATGWLASLRPCDAALRLYPSCITEVKKDIPKLN